MTNVSVQKSFELFSEVGDWKRITTAVDGVIRTVLGIKEVVEGQNEYLWVGTDGAVKAEYVERLKELVQMFPKDIECKVEQNGVYVVASKTSQGRDILLRQFTKLVISL
jgi:hypothetical protein